MKDRVFQHLGHVGSGLSLACAVHCLLMPFLIAVLPLVGLSFMAHGAFDLILIMAAILAAVANFCWGYRKHNKLSPGVWIAIGSILFLLGQFHALHAHHVVISVVGGVCFLASNLLNRKLCKSCETCCHEDHAE